jgi:hypothetical protein
MYGDLVIVFLKRVLKVADQMFPISGGLQQCLSRVSREKLFIVVIFSDAVGIDFYSIAAGFFRKTLSM